MRRLALFLMGFAPIAAMADEYRIGNFGFAIPSQWEVHQTATEVVATLVNRKPTPDTFLKIEGCIATELNSCKGDLESYYCVQVLPIIKQYPNGLKERRKTCSLESPNSMVRIGMLLLSLDDSNLGLILMSGEGGPLPSEFIDTFLESLTVK